MVYKLSKMKRGILLLCFTCALSFVAACHNPGVSDILLREWNVGNTKVKASFLLMRNDTVFLEKENAEVLKVPVSAISDNDRSYADEKCGHIERLNQQGGSAKKRSTTGAGRKKENLIIALILITAVFVWLCRRRKSFRYAPYFIAAGFLSLVYSFKIKPLIQLTSVTSPSFIDSAFVPFKPNVNTFWDTTYFYIESKGIPSTHSMMTGIVSWQQQVPIPQCYTGTNAWSIPLKPVIATTPVPVNASHFSRGAIAIAVNGVPIFNPYTNTGVDAYLDGQLDNWGGHSGRADDYHYHIAPLHLYGTTSATLPIAFALDGFAVYGAYEPDGSPMAALDANHGHYGSNGVYHYHGSSSAPYMIGNMVGQVTEDTTFQIVPQAQATAVRPPQNPLSGAVITNCTSNGSNGYILTYTLSGQTYQVNYSWSASGTYTFNYIDPANTTTATYNGFVPCDLPAAVHSFSGDSRRLELYPNPSVGEFSLRLDKTIQPADVKKISIFSASGQLVYSVSSYQSSFSIGKLSPGLYFVYVKTRSDVFVKKLIVE